MFLTKHCVVKTYKRRGSLSLLKRACSRWLVSGRRFYDCIEQLSERRITIYATADEVASFPPSPCLWLGGGVLGIGECGANFGLFGWCF
jgi:hypothetical protein